MGYDVFAGTFRGCSPIQGEHVDPNISRKEFWNFTVNEHAFQDLPAFIKKIREIKQEEFASCDHKDNKGKDKAKTTKESSEESKIDREVNISIISHSVSRHHKTN